MPLFPQQFIDDLKSHADIVLVIQDYVSLKKSGANYKGLCPFHGEKTPSFQVNRDKGFFHCFGCNVGGDVFKFLELHEKIGFQDAVKLLAQRFGLTLPELEQSEDQRAGSVERETLLKLHEAAAAWFQSQLSAPGGARIRALISERGVSPETSASLGLGFAPGGRNALTEHLLKAGFAQGLVLRGGLAVQREDGSVVDRFRSRLIIPICRDTGSVIAFGGRALDDGQQPKYLNSPETPIYAKSRTLYGLNLSKAAIRQQRYAVLVEGYFDFAQVYQAGFPVVASCGTALTSQQAALLRRFASKVVMSYDPDAAGQGATARSCELLVAEGFDANVAMLPPGEDPDTFVRRHGAQGYSERLQQSQPYLDFLLDRAAAAYNLSTAEGRANLIAEMVPVGARLPNEVRRQLFAEALSGKARVSHDIVWKEFQKTGQPQASKPAERRTSRIGQVTKAEMALLWWLVHRPERALEALAEMDAEDVEGLASRPVLDLAGKLNEDKGFSPAVLIERLGPAEATLVTEAAAESEPPSLDPSSSVQEIRRIRYDRERGVLQVEIDRLEKQNASEHAASIDALRTKRFELLRRMGAIDRSLLTKTKE